MDIKSIFTTTLTRIKNYIDNKTAEIDVNADWHADTDSYSNIKNKPITLPANGGNADTAMGYSIWAGTQEEYDSLYKTSNTIYMINKD